MEESVWHSRGYLPHREVPGRQFLTWRLDDAVPNAVIDLWKADLAHEEDAFRSQELNRRIERFADAGHGSCPLRDPRAARIMQEALFHDHGKSYDLLAWAIMPNHVHTVLEPLGGNRLPKIVQAF